VPPKPCLRKTEAESLGLVWAVSRAARAYDEAGFGKAIRYGWTLFVLNDQRLSALATIAGGSVPGRRNDVDPLVRLHYALRGQCGHNPVVFVVCRELRGQDPKPGA
jgi:hypothetical protein